MVDREFLNEFFEISRGNLLMLNVVNFKFKVQKADTKWFTSKKKTFNMFDNLK